MCVASALSHSRSSSRGSLDEFLSSQAAKKESSVSAKQKSLLEYSIYMANYVGPSKATSANTSPGASPHSSPSMGKKVSHMEKSMCLNLCVGLLVSVHAFCCNFH